MAVKDDALAAQLVGAITARSGLSQAELARRAGLDRSVLSAYAHGRRQPSVAALGRIARAAGLEVELTPSSGSVADERAGMVLSQVIGLACAMPFKGRGELDYPPLIRLRPQL